MLPSNVLSWFCIYLATGVVALLVTRLVVFFIMRKRDKPSEGLRNILQAMKDTRRQPIKWNERAEQYLLVLPLMLLLWPLIIPIVLKEHFYPKVWKPDPEAAFTCRRNHLVRVVSPDVVQAEATVVDPLGRVPAAPFGHLNAGWRAFRASMEPEDWLWYFEVLGVKPEPGDGFYQPQWSEPQGGRRGYALVRSGKVRVEFIFEWD